MQQANIIDPADDLHALNTVRADADGVIRHVKARHTNGTDDDL